MRSFPQACEKIAGITKKLEKVAIVADLLTSLSPENSSVAAVFLSGRPFPVWEETTLQVGGRLLWRVVQEISGKSEQELTAAYRRLGDLGAVAGDILDASSDKVSELKTPEIQDFFRRIASARGPAVKSVLVRE